MGRKVYNKLVRDKIPEIIEATGAKPKTRILSDAEYLQELIKKLGEEYEEFKADNNIEELADLHEVLLGLADALGVTRDELEKVRAQKAERRGAFTKRIFLEHVDE